MLSVNTAMPLVKTASLSAVEVLAKLVLNYFFKTKPRGTETSPFFKVDKKGSMEKVIMLFRAELVEALGEEKTRELSVVNGVPGEGEDPESKLDSQSSLRGVKYFQIVNLRSKHVDLKGSVRDIVEHIHAQLWSYYESYRKGIFYNDPDWGTTKPIEDPILLILLLIDRVVHTIGSYRKRINPDDAISLVRALSKFTFKLGGDSELSNDGRDGSQVTLAALFSDSDIGINTSLSNLREIFTQEKKRRLFVLAVQKLELTLANLGHALQAYTLEWLQGSDKEEDRTSPEVVIAASKHIFPQKLCYANLEERVRKGSLTEVAKSFCAKRRPDEVFFILKLMVTPFNMSDREELSKPERVLEGLGEELNYFCSSNEKVYGVEGFKDYCISQIQVVLKAVGLHALSAKSILDLILWSRYLSLVKGIFERCSQLGNSIGCMAGALLPNIIKILNNELLHEVENALENHIKG